MSHDPADTLSNVLPSLPPPAPGDGHLSVLDPRFPIGLDEPAHIFWQLAGEWEDRETVISQTIRATQQHAVPEERFIRPLETQPLPAITEPVVYLELAEATLAHEWDTGPGDAIPDVDELPRRHRHRGPGGRFVPAGGA